jgi:hypothetical protein
MIFSAHECLRRLVRPFADCLRSSKQIICSFHVNAREDRRHNADYALAALVHSAMLQPSPYIRHGCEYNPEPCIAGSWKLRMLRTRRLSLRQRCIGHMLRLRHTPVRRTREELRSLQRGVLFYLPSVSRRANHQKKPARRTTRSVGNWLEFVSKKPLLTAAFECWTISF